MGILDFFKKHSQSGDGANGLMVKGEAMNSYIKQIAEGEIREWDIAHKVPMEVYISQLREIKNAVAYYNEINEKSDRNMGVTFIHGGTKEKRHDRAQGEISRFIMDNDCSDRAVYRKKCTSPDLTGYRGEPVVLYEECAPFIHINNFVKLTDPYQSYHPKMHNCKELIITSEMPLEAFIDRLSGRLDREERKELVGSIRQINLNRKADRND